MRHYQACQRKSDGRWDFVQSRGSEEPRPVGYCRPAMTEADYEYLEKHLNYTTPTADRERHAATAHKHHLDGHATKEEACACYHEYQLDHSLQLDREMSDQQQKCRKCQAWTSKYAMLGESKILVLCDEHNNRETVAELTKPSEQYWIS
jgi:hypothetical protein